MSVRKFTLNNARGDLFDLYNDLDYFAITPINLGITFNNSYIGTNANFIQNERELAQNTFEVQMIFGAETKKAYEKFYEFVKFLNYPPYVLNYEIPGVGEFKRNCDLNELSKSEINTFSVIQENLSFYFLSPWYKIVTNEENTQNNIYGDGKIYDYAYDFVYDYSTRLGLTNVFILVNQSIYLGSSLGSPLKIEIEGPCENPHWEIIQDGEIVQQDGFNMSVPENHKLIVSSFPENQEAVLVNNNGDSFNAYPYQDLNKSNFCVVPLGTSALVVHADNANVTYSARYEWVVT